MSQDGEGSITKLRAVAYALLAIAVIAAAVPLLGLAADEEPVASKPVTTTATSVAATQPATTSKKTTEKTRETTAQAAEQTAQPGPDLDERRDQANSELRRNKLIVGGAAAALFGLVLWGRRIRSKRRKDND